MLKAIQSEIARLNLPLYHLAVMTDDGLENWSCQPANACNNSYSVAKAFTMTAIGLLTDDGALRVEEPIARVLPLPADCDPRWAQVTIEHALKHRIGFDRGFLDIDVEDIYQYGTDDFLSIVFHQSLAYAPGTHFQYSDAAFYLLSRVVEACAGLPLDAFLMKRLFLPLRFQEVAWSRCPQNHPMGATGLYIRAQDMVKLGWLYLNEGRWEEKRILSRDWVSLALARGYELSPIGRTGLVGKGGMNGQMLLFSPKARFTAAWHAYETDNRTQALIALFQSLQ